MDNQFIPHWLNGIPKNWEIKKVKNLFNERVEKNVDLDVNYLSVMKDIGVVPYSEKGNTGNKTSDNTENYKLVYEGDIVVNPMNVIIGSVGRSRFNGCLSSVYIVLKPKDDVNSSYYHYVFFSKEFQRYLKRIASGLMEIRESIDKTEFFTEKLPYPPLNEQSLISNYLDKRVQSLDLLIKKIEKKIELLKEKYNSTIERLITKGLDTNVKLKDSGVDWIGDIPSHWDVKPLFTVFHENKKKNKDGSLDVLTLSYGQIKLRDISKFDGLFPETFDGYQCVSPNYIIIRSTDLQNDHKSLRVGYVGIDGVITSAYLGIIPNKEMDTKFFYYSIHLSDLKKVLYGLGGGLRQSLRYDDFKRFPIICPPEEEQKEIVELLEREQKSLSVRTDLYLHKIQLLKEYRDSLINNVVTGKVRITRENYE